MKAARSIAIFHAIFLITGTATVLLGVLLAHSTMGDSATGTLLTTQFSGQVLGSLLVTRHPTRTLSIGLVVSILSAGVLAFLTEPQKVVLFALGLGLGCVMSSVNTAAGLEVAPEKRASALELLNVFWPIGAAVAPPLAALFARFAHGSHLYAILAALYATCLGWLLLTRPVNAAAVEQREATDRAVPALALANLCLIAFLVIGVETAIAAWLPTLAQRDHATLPLAAAIPAGYWTGSLVSRIVAAALLRKMALPRLALIAAIGTCVATVLVPLSLQPTFLLAAAMAAAAAIAPLYPALLAVCVDLRLKGLIFMAGGLGSAAAPWLVGRVSTHLGSLHRALLLAPLGAAIMLLSMARAGLFRSTPEPGV